MWRFLNITQNTKQVVFCGTFTAGGLEAKVGNGKLTIIKEGKNKKFLNQVEQITFSGEYAHKTKQSVMYITERMVFCLAAEGMVLTKIVPGIDLKRDVLNLMEFETIIAKDLKVMDIRIFQDEKMIWTAC